MKKNRRRLKKQISVGATVFCLIAAGCLALLLTPIFDVDTVTVTGNNAIATEDIVRNSGIIKGVNIFSVSLTAAQDRLSAMNGIDTVKVRRSLPSTIRINVTEGNPLVYVESGGSYVGITAAGKVVDVAEAGSAAAAVISAGLSVPVTDETVEKPEESDEELDEETDGDKDGGTEALSAQRQTPGRTVVYGMGAFTYTYGRKIEFQDKIRAEKLSLLMNGFLGDDICRGFTTIDMAAYDNINLVYQGRLNVRLGDAERLEYKLKCFKKLISENLGEDASGTLDLERLTYSPKK